MRFRSSFISSVVTALIVSAVQPARADDRNLVTLLLPAPIESVDDEFYPRLTTVRGPSDLRLHEWVFQGFKLRRSHEKIENARADYARMRAIGFRIDPCFRFVGSDRCQPQLRVVWQAFSRGIADDVALHSFHGIGNATDFQFLMSASRELDRTPVDPASPVHPHFQRFGLMEARSQLFLGTIRRLIAEYPPHEIAAQTLEDETGIHWGFQHFRVREGQTSALLAIPRIEVFKQTFLNWARPIEFISTLVPEISPIFENIPFFRNSMSALTEMPDSQRRRFRARVGQVLDADHEPFHGEIDCVSCHVARAVRDVLDDRAGRSTVRLRMLGYHRDQPVISDRVHSETDRILRRYSRELNAN